jgi:hypothetical protein
MNKKGNIENKIALAFGIFIILLIASAGIFGTIIDSFSFMGGYGIFAGVLLCIIIIIGIINASFGK